MEAENARLKKRVANQAFDIDPVCTIGPIHANPTVGGVVRAITSL